ncbi:MAG: AAA family ATPase [Cyanobacteriota bacterium]|jgi:class 3 adenylate cyclase/predicted ATPase
MTFEEILTQVIKALQDEGRISYRALQRRFNLDDADLDDIKVELIEAKRLACDENGRILVRDPASSLLAGQGEPQSELPAVLAPQAKPADLALNLPTAERRQLTVLFCDLVDSTRLSQQLDPEDLREVIRSYQEACVAVLLQFGGYVAQYLGDGLLVYFGYPQAHEDDAQRAVRSGLGILKAMTALTLRSLENASVRLSVRIGIHTGLVVVGEIGGGGRYEQLALGDTPNLAARLQSLAEPNTVVISPNTARLVEGYFICRDLGVHTLKGFDMPVPVVQVVEENSAQSRLEAAERRGFTPLVGRETEVALLRERWLQSYEGRGQVVLLSGEAGIGKSRLVRMLSEQVGKESTQQFTFCCSPYYTTSALAPVIAHLHNLLNWDCEPTADARLTRLEQMTEAARLPLTEVVPLLAALLTLPIPERYSPTVLAPQRQKRQTQEFLVALLLAETARRPLLMIWEDVHWADPSTLELLGLLLDQAPTARLLLVLTARPDFRFPWPPRAYVTPLTLTRLLRPQVEALVLQVTDGKPLPAEVLRQIVVKTDGIPLFVEELVKTVLESGFLRDETAGYVLTSPLPPLAIPTTLQDALMARLDRLAPVKAIAQLGAVIGREFSYTLLRFIAPMEESKLQAGLAQLVESELLYQRGSIPQSIYVFKHALVQDAAYYSLLRRVRQQYHRQIAEAMEGDFPEICAEQPELLAQHYAEAGGYEQAMTYWRQAGQQAIQRSANLEAIERLTRGMEALTTLPDTPERMRQELEFQLALGPVWMNIKGPAATEMRIAYERAYYLCEKIGNSEKLFSVLWGLWYCHNGGATHDTAKEVGEQLLGLAERLEDSACLVLAHRALGNTFYHRGDLAPARSHLDLGIELYDSSQHRSLTFLYGQDLAVVCRAWSALTLWLLGYPDQALMRIGEALALAKELAHFPSLAYALIWAAMLHRLRREWAVAQEYAAAAIALTREQGLNAFLMWATIQHGWALAMQGQGAEGINQILQGIAGCRADGVTVNRVCHLALLAEAYIQTGQAAQAQPIIIEALAEIAQTEERNYESELYRLKGECLLECGSERGEDAAVCFRQALEIARRQQAKSLELRAAMSLSRLLQQQGKRAEARPLLFEVYSWFTEGSESRDLQDAKNLLKSL